MPEKTLKADIIIVGSGVGGATVARELAKKGKKIVVVEKGHFFSLAQIGTELCAYNFYDKHGMWSKTKEGIFYYRTIMTGGTSIVSCGNGVRCLEKELTKLGIDLRKEFIETEKELGITPVPNRLMGEGTRRIMEAASRLDFEMKPMPKMINFKKCIRCGNCVVGCRPDAKWTALKYLNEARKNGALVMEQLDVNKVLISKRRAVGIAGTDAKGKIVKLFGNTIILAAGGIGTPIILQNSGIKAGQKLFLDLFTVTIGLAEKSDLRKELTMAAVCHKKGFILSPYIDSSLFALASTIPLPLRRNLSLVANHNRMLGIMVKIDDDLVGRVRKDGTVEKTVTSNDLAKLARGQNAAKRILIEAGAKPDSIITSKIRGAHPGGTAAIGEVVNKKLETKIKGLYVCDASILPETPGLPPVVTIIALAKKFTKNLLSAQRKS